MQALPEDIESLGSISRNIDIVPTILSLAQTERPETYKGQALMPLRGTDIIPLARGKKQASDKTMFFEHQGFQAARIGNWKIVRPHNQEWELYNLEKDPTELDNLIQNQPEKANSLKRQFNQWAEECGVRPWPVQMRPSRRQLGPNIDQRLPHDREERQWDQTPPYWLDTPLGQWAIEANRWDGIDPIPPESPHGTPY